MDGNKREALFLENHEFWLSAGLAKTSQQAYYYHIAC